MLALRLPGVGDGLPIGHLGHLGDHLHAELARDPGHRHIEVRVPEPGEHRLLGLRPAFYVESGVLLDRSLQGGRQLVLVVGRLGAHRQAHHRRRVLDRLDADRRTGTAQGVTGEGRFHLGHGCDIARHHLSGVVMLLALHEEQVVHAALGAAGWVLQLVVDPQGAGEDAEQRDATHVRVGQRLEDVCHGGPVGC